MFNLLNSTWKEFHKILKDLNLFNFLKLNGLVITSCSFIIILILGFLIIEFYEIPNLSLFFNEPFIGLFFIIVLFFVLLYFSSFSKVLTFQYLRSKKLNVEGFETMVWSYFKYKVLFLVFIILLIGIIYTLTLSTVQDTIFFLFSLLFLFSVLTFFIIILLLVDFFVEKLLLPFAFFKNINLIQSFKESKKVLKQKWRSVLNYFFMILFFKFLNLFVLIISLVSCFIIIALISSPVLLYNPELVQLLTEQGFNHIIRVFFFILLTVLITPFILFEKVFELKFTTLIHKRIKY